MTKSFAAGDTVYVIYRNPHAANVAHIKEAEIVHHPYHEENFLCFYTKPIIRWPKMTRSFRHMRKRKRFTASFFEEDRYH